MVTVIENPVKKRRVFYIPGYDPFPARRYRELYRKEAAEQARISGYSIALKARQNTPGYGWHVASRMEGQDTVAEVDVLIWSDLVRRSMKNSIPATYWQMLWVAWVYISSGALRRLSWLRKGPVIAALYPIAVLMLQLLVAVLVGWIIGGLVGRFTFAILGWAAFALCVGAILYWFRKIDRRLYAYYLMHDYAYTAWRWGANAPELDDRLAEFKQTIARALSDDIDEVLVVGHSSGAHLAVHILSDLVRDGFVKRDGPKLAFLSLGQVIPMVSFLPRAHHLRADLHDLSQSDQLTWVDVSAPGDGCSFALCDPVSVTGVAPAKKRWPLVISAAFSQTLSPPVWKKLRRRYFRLHFQYLCAFDQPNDYDYFQITGGPVTLEDRYRDRAPSKSRIDVSASAYTSMGA